MIANYPSDEYQYKEYRDTSKYFLSIITHQHLRKIGWTASHKNWRKLWKPKKFCEMLLLVVVLIHPKFFSRAIFVNNLHIPPHTQLSPHSIQHQEDLTKRSPKKFFNKIMFFVVESPIELFYVHSLKNVPSL